MISLLDAYELRQNQELRSRTCVACWLVASNIVQENPAVPNHDARLKWAGIAGFADLNSRVVDAALIAVMRRAVELDKGLTIDDALLVIAVGKAVDSMVLLF